MKNIRLSTVFGVLVVLLVGAACGEDECSTAACLQAAEAGVDGTTSADLGVDVITGADGAAKSDTTPQTDQSSPPESDLGSVDNSVDKSDSLPPAGLVSVSQAVQLIASGTIFLLDVREPFEFSAGHIDGATNLAWTSGVLEAQWDTLPKDKGILVYCRSGNRSASAVAFLEGKGLAPLWDLQGGIGAWQAAGQPTVQ